MPHWRLCHDRVGNKLNPIGGGVLSDPGVRYWHLYRVCYTIRLAKNTFLMDETWSTASTIDPTVGGGVVCETLGPVVRYWRSALEAIRL